GISLVREGLRGPFGLAAQRSVAIEHDRRRAIGIGLNDLLDVIAERAVAAYDAGHASAARNVRNRALLDRANVEERDPALEKYDELSGRHFRTFLRLAIAPNSIPDVLREGCWRRQQDESNGQGSKWAIHDTSFGGNAAFSKRARTLSRPANLSHCTGPCSQWHCQRS